MEERAGDGRVTRQRDLTEVIDQMLAVIPESELDLRAQLEWNKSDASFKAPELMRDCWERVASTLLNAIGTPTEDWEWEVAKIFTGKDQR